MESLATILTSQIICAHSHLLLMRRPRRLRWERTGTGMIIVASVYPRKSRAKPKQRIYFYVNSRALLTLAPGLGDWVTRR